MARKLLPSSKLLQSANTPELQNSEHTAYTTRTELKLQELQFNSEENTKEHTVATDFKSLRQSLSLRSLSLSLSLSLASR